MLHLSPSELDTINGLFELTGAAARSGDIRRLIIDKRVEGISYASATFFMTWGVWNLVYYAGLDQWMSYIGGAALSLASLTWLALAICYARRNHETVGAHI